MLQSWKLLNVDSVPWVRIPLFPFIKHILKDVLIIEERTQELEKKIEELEERNRIHTRVVEIQARSEE